MTRRELIRKGLVAPAAIVGGRYEIARPEDAVREEPTRDCDILDASTFQQELYVITVRKGRTLRRRMFKERCFLVVEDGGEVTDCRFLHLAGARLEPGSVIRSCVCYVETQITIHKDVTMTDVRVNWYNSSVSRVPQQGPFLAGR